MNPEDAIRKNREEFGNVVLKIPHGNVLPQIRSRPAKTLESGERITDLLEDFDVVRTVALDFATVNATGIGFAESLAGRPHILDKGTVDRDSELFNTMKKFLKIGNRRGGFGDGEVRTHPNFEVTLLSPSGYGGYWQSGYRQKTLNCDTMTVTICLTDNKSREDCCEWRWEGLEIWSKFHAVGNLLRYSQYHIIYRSAVFALSHGSSEF
jgi:hypothetical protein